MEWLYDWLTNWRGRCPSISVASQNQPRASEWRYRLEMQMCRVRVGVVLSHSTCALLSRTMAYGAALVSVVC